MSNVITVNALEPGVGVVPKVQCWLGSRDRKIPGALRPASLAERAISKFTETPRQRLIEAESD